jgi:hypothetical protein
MLSRDVTDPPDCLSVPGLAFGRLDEFLERLVRGIRAHREHRRLAHQLRDRLQVVQRDLRFARGERARDPDAGDEAQRVRVVLLLGDRRGRHRAVAAGLVDDHHAHRDQLLLLHHVGDGAAEHVVAAAGAGVHDDLHRLGGLPLACAAGTAIAITDIAMACISRIRNTALSSLELNVTLPSR